MKLHSVAILMKHGDLYLGVSRRDNHEDFGLPGGKIDEGETPTMAIIRELREEAGIIVKPDIIDNCFVFERRDHGKVCRTYIYSGPTLPIKEGVHEDNGGLCKWVTKEDLCSGSFAVYNLALFKAFSKYYYDNDGDPRGKFDFQIRDLKPGSEREVIEGVVESSSMQKATTKAVREYVTQSPEYGTKGDEILEVKIVRK